MIAAQKVGKAEFCVTDLISGAQRLKNDIYLRQRAGAELLRSISSSCFTQPIYAYRIPSGLPNE